MATRNPKAPLVIDTLKHEGATRKNIPTAEYQSVMAKDEQSPKPVAYPRANTQWLSDLAALHDQGKTSDAFQQRLNRDLDPQLLWRGKDQQDWSDLVVSAPPLYIQEKVHPKVLIDDLRRETERQREASARSSGQPADQPDLFADFNGLPSENARTEFYQHDGHWANRLILGDSLQVMASLAEREGLRGKVQCIYFDPPYGIKFNSNFQWSTTSRDVKDGNAQHITREPEQVKAFRDTWRDGIHSYLTYLRDRLTVARDLLTESGSIFVQIGDENVHRVRAVMDEVFGDERYVNTIAFKKKSATSSTESVFDYIIWFCKSKSLLKIRPLLEPRNAPEDESKFNTLVSEPMDLQRASALTAAEIEELLANGARWARVNYPIVSQDPSETRSGNYDFRGSSKECGTNKHWRYSPDIGMSRLDKAGRLFDGGGKSLAGVVFWDDWNQVEKANIWEDMHGEKKPVYVVQTTTSAIERCIHLSTDPGDLVLDPTCGSGTAAYVAEQWGRRWITIDTSRVALALARARIMGARYTYYLLADSREGQLKEAEVTRTAPSTAPVHGDVRHGFVYERVPRITLGRIANNTEIDVIWDHHQQVLKPLRASLNTALGKVWQEWEIPRDADVEWPEEAQRLHAQWWQQRIARQKAIDASIAAKAEFEYLYDKPYPDKNKVRVAGPFTVESLSPHRVLAVGADDELIDPANPRVAERQAEYNAERNFVQIILENLKTAGVQQAHKQDRISFTSLTPWPGELVCAEARYAEGDTEKRAAIFIGPEFGTVARPDLVAAAREAGDAGFDVLIACAFNYDAHSSEFDKLGRIPVLKARMNADLHMADDLKNTGKGNLFVIFGEPDIDILDAGPHGAEGQVRVKVNGVDVFHPNTGEVRSDGAEGIACWLIDTDYNEESFFVRQAYFLGANDPYKSLKTTLKAEIDADAWATLNSDTSRPFDKPKSGRIAVKVINHLGDEVMKVFRVQ
ncbi:site-specific DNA-methyltransferase [Variovorax boronicumulans]|uniref:site-specific DNA-methyltransferase n=1 Tax=Variovorax boronicumulans TaxID=436515 RepID=UPI0012E47567|nr:site-specific DNA-methyltransferase [Variovorax boronicumulans]GER21334.1 site-specific DNA-methyltransferase [Variovorax boronicumulans]